MRRHEHPDLDRAALPRLRPNRTRATPSEAGRVPAEWHGTCCTKQAACQAACLSVARNMLHEAGCVPSAWHETCFNSAHALRCAEHVHVTSTSHARHLARILLRAACSVPRSGTQLGTRPASCSMFRATRLARGLLRSASPVFGSGVAVGARPGPSRGVHASSFHRDTITLARVTALRALLQGFLAFASARFGRRRGVDLRRLLLTASKSCATLLAL